MSTQMTAPLPAEVGAVLAGTPIAHIATVLPDGAPHAVPVWIGTHEGQVVFLTGPGSQKARNLRRDPRVAISIAPPENPFSPVIIRGTVVDWLDGDEGWAVVDEIARKYIGASYGREQDRVVGVVTTDHVKMGM
jgi:PPOX class probable F420-dependent enzyme